MKTFYQLGSVRRVWQEYNEGVDGGPALRKLEEGGPEWRKDFYQAYRRRIRIVHEVERRAEEVGVDKAIEELDALGSLHSVTEMLRLRNESGRRRGRKRGRRPGVNGSAVLEEAPRETSTPTTIENSPNTSASTTAQSSPVASQRSETPDAGGSQDDPQKPEAHLGINSVTTVSEAGDDSAHMDEDSDNGPGDQAEEEGPDRKAMRKDEHGNRLVPMEEDEEPMQSSQSSQGDYDDI